MAKALQRSTTLQTVDQALKSPTRFEFVFGDRDDAVLTVSSLIDTVKVAMTLDGTRYTPLSNGSYENTLLCLTFLSCRRR